MRLAAYAAAFACVFLNARPAGSSEDSQSGIVDVRHSQATFEVAHLYVTRVSGRVPIVAATLALAPGALVPASVSATLDARRIDSGDADRDADLQGPDWFDTKQFPTWTFASTAVSVKTGNAFVVAGLLTAHGVAQAMTFEAMATRGYPHPAFHAVGHVDRHAFGMRVTPTDGLIGGDVTVTLDVELR